MIVVDYDIFIGLFWINCRFQGTYTGFRAMVFNVTFNNILVILWRLALLAEETAVPGKNQRPTRNR